LDKVALQLTSSNGAFVINEQMSVWQHTDCDPHCGSWEFSKFADGDVFQLHSAGDAIAERCSKNVVMKYFCI